MRQVWLLLGTPTPETAPATNGTAELWPLIGGLLGFAAIMALSYLGLKYLSKRNLSSARGRHMQVLDRIVIGRDSMILLVRVAGKVLVTGVTKEGIHTLGELAPEELIEERPERRAAEPKGETPREKGFWGRFVHNLGVNSGLLPKDTAIARPEAAKADGTSFGAVLARSQAAASAPEGEPFGVEPTTACAPEAEAEQKQAAPPEGIPEPQLRPESKPEISGAAEDGRPARAGATPDYNEAIRRMRQYGRMVIDARARPDPTPAENLAVLKAARAYAAGKKEQPAAAPQKERVVEPPAGREPEPDRREAAPAETGNINSLSERISRKKEQLSRRLEKSAR